MDGNERVVVIKGNPEKWYSQAVFILNPQAKTEEIPKDFVAEAEKIIFNYMARKQNGLEDKPHTHLWDDGPAKKNKRRIKLDFLLDALMILACVGLVAVVAYGLLQ